MKATERASLQDVLAQAKWPMDAEPSVRADGPTDALRMIYWCRGLSDTLKTSSSYELGKILEPESYWVSDDGRKHCHSNKWSKYVIGRHVPHMTLVRHVDTVCPGSAAELNHVLWKVLRRRPQGRMDIERLEAELGVQARKELMLWRSKKTLDTKDVDRRFATALKMLDCLDSLAALQLQCERAWIAKDTFAALRWAGHLDLAFLAHGHELLRRGIARPLMELMIKRLFSAIVHDGKVYRLTGAGYIKKLDYFLAHDILLFEPNIWHPSTRSPVKRIRKFVATQYVLGPLWWQRFASVVTANP